jgi:hypothetical protein
MEFTETIRLWLFQTSLPAFENPTTKIAFDPGRVFHEPLDRNIVGLRNDIQGGRHAQTDAPDDLLLDKFEDLFFHYY